MWRATWRRVERDLAELAMRGMVARMARKKSGYDEFKEFEGQRYTGMKVGRRHRWKYDAGDWTEKKVTPERWEFHYAVVKRRAGHAPEGSGAPVGTSYRWTIVAEQIVTKIDANSYMTEMAGVKYKLAHRRADKPSWNASEANQRKRKAALLEELAEDVEEGADPAVVAEPEPAAEPKTAKPRPKLAANGGAKPRPKANGGAKLAANGGAKRRPVKRAATAKAPARRAARRRHR